MFQVSKRSWFIVAGLVLSAAALAPSSFAGGRRVAAQLDEPFEVNGRLFPAGELSLREVSNYTPVAALSELRVDGRCLGILLAQDIPGAPDAGNDELIFERNAAGHLVLVSMALRGRPARDLFTFAESSGAPWVPLAPKREAGRGLLVASGR